MKISWIIVVALAMFCCFEIRAVEATMCEPFSSFKVDCNTCFCGKDGSRYACTRKLCKGEPEYLNEEEFKERNFDDDSYNVVFLNDEMPSDNEVFEERKEEEEEYPVPPLVREDARFDRSFQDVDLDEQEAEYVNVPDNYRYRKDIFT